MKKYHINWLDPRVRRRCLKIIDFIEREIGLDQPTLHRKTLNAPDAFGNHQVGRYIKSRILIKTNHSYKPGEYSQQYKLNVEYFNELVERLGLPPRELRYNRIEQRFQEQETAIVSGDFEYNKSSLRWHNGLQHIERQCKALFWAKYDYWYDYDIDCCAPTLLSQQAKKLSPKMKPLTYIDFYISNKREVRDQLSIKHNLSGGQVKIILNGLFQGGVLNFFEGNKILALLGNNTYKMRQLINDPFLRGLSRDLSRMWSKIRPHIDIGSAYYGDRQVRNKLSGKHKAEYYRSLEHEVMSVVWKSLSAQDIKFFKEHDGWRSDTFVVPDDLSQLVFNKTGFRVTFTWAKSSKESQ